MKLKKGDLVYSQILEKVFQISGKKTEFDFREIWGSINNRGVLKYTTIDGENGDFIYGTEIVQYIPKVGDVLVRGKDFFLTKSVDDEGVNAVSIAPPIYYKHLKFHELSSVSILRNFKLG